MTTSIPLALFYYPCQCNRSIVLSALQLLPLATKLQETLLARHVKEDPSATPPTPALFQTPSGYSGGTPLSRDTPPLVPQHADSPELPPIGSRSAPLRPFTAPVADALAGPLPGAQSMAEAKSGASPTGMHPEQTLRASMGELRSSGATSARQRAISHLCASAMVRRNSLRPSAAGSNGASSAEAQSASNVPSGAGDPSKVPDPGGYAGMHGGSARSPAQQVDGAGDGDERLTRMTTRDDAGEAVGPAGVDVGVTPELSRVKRGLRSPNESPRKPGEEGVEVETGPEPRASVEGGSVTWQEEAQEELMEHTEKVERGMRCVAVG